MSTRMSHKAVLWCRDPEVNKDGQCKMCSRSFFVVLFFYVKM